MFFANTVSPSDFYSEEKGQILFQSSWTAPPSRDKLGNIWHRSIMYSNSRLDQLWGYVERRHYASHGPYFFSLEVLRRIIVFLPSFIQYTPPQSTFYIKDMYELLPDMFAETSRHPFRHEHDVSIPFMYNNWADHYYETTIARSTINQYMKVCTYTLKCLVASNSLLA